MLIGPEQALAYGFESRVESLTKKLATVFLPLMSVLGLIFAAILAVVGDASAKGRVYTVIGMSLIGFLAQAIIKWVQSASGGF